MIVFALPGYLPLPELSKTPNGHPGLKSRRSSSVSIQAGAGIVADSKPEAEYEETVNKAAALGRAIDLAEQAFVEDGRVALA